VVDFVSGYHTGRYPSLRQFDAGATTFLPLHIHLLALTKETARSLNRILCGENCAEVFQSGACSVVRDGVQFEGICISNYLAGADYAISGGVFGKQPASSRLFIAESRISPLTRPRHTNRKKYSFHICSLAALQSSISVRAGGSEKPFFSHHSWSDLYL
jgi:hypothetical protein